MTKRSIQGSAGNSAGILTKQFHKLSVACIKADKDVVAATVNIHTALAQAFVLYLKLKKRPTVLDKIYKKESVKGSSKENTSEFTPFVKVLFRLDLPNPKPADRKRHQLTPQSMRNRVSEYAAVLDMLDDEYADRPKDFQSKAEAKFKAFIGKIGGVSGSVKARAEKNAKRDGKQATSAYDEEVAQSKAWIADNALTMVTTKIIGSAGFTKSGSPRINGVGCGALIYRQAANGQFEVLAASNDNDAIQAIAVDAASVVDKVQDPSLRLLSQAVATQCCPEEFGPKGSRAESSGKRHKWLKAVDATAARLLVRQKGILLSGAGQASSVVTILRPAKPLLGSNDPDVYLDTDQERMLEDWVATGTAVARTASPSNGLGKPGKGQKGVRGLTVTNSATKKSRRLDFHGLRKAGPQVDLDLSKFKPTCSFTADRVWFGWLRAEFFDDWFATTVAGNKLTRREHRLLKITVKKTEFVIGYERDDTGKHPEAKFGLGTTGSTKATLKKGKRVAFEVAAIDFAPVFYNIAERDIAGPVEVSGDADIILLKFTCGQDDYTIAIPTAKKSDNSQGVVRKASPHMTSYPTKTAV
jgi:hypothetical protein